MQHDYEIHSQNQEVGWLSCQRHRRCDLSLVIHGAMTQIPTSDWLFCRRYIKPRYSDNLLSPCTPSRTGHRLSSAVSTFATNTPVSGVWMCLLMCLENVLVEQPTLPGEHGDDEVNSMSPVILVLFEHSVGINTLSTIVTVLTRCFAGSSRHYAPSS